MLENSTKSSPSTQTLANPCPNDSRKVVLVVDDEHFMLTMLVRLLQKLPLEVIVATSAADALDMLTTRRVDILLTDYAMPGMNGIDLLTTVRAAYPHTARLMMTALNDPALLEEATRDGLASQVLLKPEGVISIRKIVTGLLQENPQPR